MYCCQISSSSIPICTGHVRQTWAVRRLAVTTIKDLLLPLASRWPTGMSRCNAEVQELAAHHQEIKHLPELVAA